MNRFILFHGTRHPVPWASPEVEAFLRHLAVERKVSASTQNQAMSAILPPRCAPAVTAGALGILPRGGGYQGRRRGPGDGGCAWRCSAMPWAPQPELTKGAEVVRASGRGPAATVKPGRGSTSRRGRSIRGADWKAETQGRAAR
jgi:hypothetical protein